MTKIYNLKIQGKKYFRKKTLFLYFLYNLKFLGNLIFRGNKKLAYKIFYEFKYALKILSSVYPNDIFFKAMLNLTPKIILYKRRFGAQKREIPKPLYGNKRITYAVKSVFKFLKGKKGCIKPLDLANIILDSYNKKGEVYLLKKNMYNLALRNKFLLQMIRR
jgi:ribosomal protein S7